MCKVEMPDAKSFVLELKIEKSYYKYACQNTKECCYYYRYKEKLKGEEESYSKNKQRNESKEIISYFRLVASIQIKKE